MLTKYFDSLYNDDYLTGGETIITVMGGWEVPSTNVS